MDDLARLGFAHGESHLSRMVAGHGGLATNRLRRCVV
jgi:hypothetical protein